MGESVYRFASSSPLRLWRWELVSRAGKADLSEAAAFIEAGVVKRIYWSTDGCGHHYHFLESQDWFARVCNR